MPMPGARVGSCCPGAVVLSNVLSFLRSNSCSFWLQAASGPIYGARGISEAAVEAFVAAGRAGAGVGACGGFFDMLVKVVHVVNNKELQQLGGGRRRGSASFLALRDAGKACCARSARRARAAGAGGRASAANGAAARQRRRAGPHGGRRAGRPRGQPLQFGVEIGVLFFDGRACGCSAWLTPAVSRL